MKTALYSHARHWPLALFVMAMPWLITPAAAAQADPDDVASIESIIHAVYDVISGDAGVARDWQRWYSLFAAEASLSAVIDSDGGFQRVTMTPASYAANSGPILERDGFHETEIHHISERFGQIAHVFSTYESRRSADDSEPFARGINSFQLMNDGSRWWVVSIYWQAESEDNPVPARYGG
jgi:hypothetical protein